MRESGQSIEQLLRHPAAAMRMCRTLMRRLGLRQPMPATVLTKDLSYAEVCRIWRAERQERQARSKPAVSRGRHGSRT